MDSKKVSQVIATLKRMAGTLEVNPEQFLEVYGTHTLGVLIMKLEESLEPED
jgi:hypothetical protein